jgi:hypothetical protein
MNKILENKTQQGFLDKVMWLAIMSFCAYLFTKTSIKYELPRQLEQAINTRELARYNNLGRLVLDGEIEDDLMDPQILLGEVKEAQKFHLEQLRLLGDTNIVNYIETHQDTLAPLRWVNWRLSLP